MVFDGRRLLGAAPFAGPLAILVIIGIFAATVLSGWLWYTCVERPITWRWSRKRTPRTPPDLRRPSEIVLGGCAN